MLTGENDSKQSDEIQAKNPGGPGTTVMANASRQSWTRTLYQFYSAFLKIKKENVRKSPRSQPYK